MRKAGSLGRKLALPFRIQAGVTGEQLLIPVGIHGIVKTIPFHEQGNLLCRLWGDLQDPDKARSQIIIVDYPIKQGNRNLEAKSIQNASTVPVLRALE